MKGAGGVLVHHNRSIVDALLDLFPEIGLSREKLKEGYSINNFFSIFVVGINDYLLDQWSDIENRVTFFEDYANSKGFDAHDPECWYNQPQEDIMGLPVSFK